MEGRGNEGRVGLAPKKLSTPQLKFLVAPLFVGPELHYIIRSMLDLNNV